MHEPFQHHLSRGYCAIYTHTTYAYLRMHPHARTDTTAHMHVRQTVNRDACRKTACGNASRTFLYKRTYIFTSHIRTAIPGIQQRNLQSENLIAIVYLHTRSRTLQLSYTHTNNMHTTCYIFCLYIVGRVVLQTFESRASVI